MRYLVVVLTLCLLPCLASASGPPNRVGIEAIDIINGGQSNAQGPASCAYGAGVSATLYLQTFRPDAVRWVNEAVGGSNLASHLPGTTRWSDLLTAVTAEIPAGQHPEALIWIHGEADSAFSPGAAALYAPNFATLIDAWRANLGNPDLPIVVAVVGTLPLPQYKSQDVIRSAQRSVCASHPPCAIVETEDLPKATGGVHYDCAGLAVLGQRIGAALLPMIP